MLLRACAIIAFLFALLLVLAATGMASEIAP